MMMIIIIMIYDSGGGDDDNNIVVLNFLFLVSVHVCSAIPYGTVPYCKFTVL